jgi:TolA-binding protein
MRARSLLPPGMTPEVSPAKTPAKTLVNTLVMSIGLIRGVIAGLIAGLIAALLFVMPAIAQTAGSGTAAPSSGSGEAASANTSVLLTRQSQRLEMLETDLREMRGQMETDLRNLKMQVTQLGNNASSGETATTAELRDLRDQVERLADAVSMASRRMERTLEITSDMEFRLLRMEKRMQTLMKLGGDELASAAVQDDTIPAGETPEVSMQRDTTTGEVTWQMNADKLNEQLEANKQQPQATDLANVGALPSRDGLTDTGAAPSVTTTPAPATGADRAAPQQLPVQQPSAPVVAAPAKPEILPDASAEEQYNFALQRAMQNDLETAEAAFAEFRQLNAGHPREADSLFWLGRIQFLRGQFEQAALTFSEFSRAYPEDARLNDTTIWVAESVSRFAPPEQACDIYRQLPSVVKEPSQRLTERLAALSEAANCGG